MENALIISSVLLWVITLFNLILTLALIRRSRARAGGELKPVGLNVGERAPDFVAETVNGERVTLADYVGRPTAFVFIDPDCGPCREYLPGYDALHSKAVRAGARLVLVSGAGKEATLPMVSEFNLQSQVLVAPRRTNSFMDDYKMRGTPSYTFIDAQGKIQAKGRPLPAMPDWIAVADSWERAATEAEPVTGAAQERR